MLQGYRWNGNLDALNDILRGGFGTPHEGFVLRIKNADVARQVLGHRETAQWLADRARNCHPSNRQHFLDRLEEARRGAGATPFDTVVEIIREHGAGGSEADDNVLLELE